MILVKYLKSTRKKGQRRQIPATYNISYVLYENVDFAEGFSAKKNVPTSRRDYAVQMPKLKMIDGSIN